MRGQTSLNFEDMENCKELISLTFKKRSLGAYLEWETVRRSYGTCLL